MNLYIDPDTRDLELIDGDIRTIHGGDDIAQAVRVTLSVFLGEWELDTRHGTDYERVLAEADISTEEIRDILAAAIYQEPQVASIETLEIARQDRELQIAFAGRLQDGTAIEMEVDAGG